MKVSQVRPKVVCFDLGGVLLRICRSWGEACTYAALLPRPGEPESLLAWADDRRRLIDDYQRGALSCEAYYQRLAALTQGQYTATDTEAIHRSWLIGEYEGVGDVLERIRKAGGVRTACLSNTNVAHWKRLLDERDVYPSLALLDVALLSHELGHIKPEEAIYAVAEERLGARGNEILFFDDLHENVDGARALGWSAECIDHALETAPQLHRWLDAYGV